MIKKIIEFIFSSKFMALLVLFFAISIGRATFLEDKFDTVTAKLLIYNAKWFEFIMFMLALNFIGQIHKHNMLSRTKIAGFIFHFSFVIMILGAGVTRYFGYEGIMPIREGETSNIMYSSEPYLVVKAQENQQIYTKDYHIVLSEFLNNSFSKELNISQNRQIKFQYVDYMKNAEEYVNENIEGEKDILEIIAFDQMKQYKILVKDGELSNIGNALLTFNFNKRPNSINITQTKEGLKISSPSQMLVGEMQNPKVDTISKNTPIDLKEKLVYRTGGLMFVFSKLYKKGKISLRKADTENGGSEILVLNLGIENKTHQISVSGGSGMRVFSHDYSFDNIDFKISYGNKPIELPFSLQCRDFILERYPGSMSPSSFASEVTIHDSKNNITKNHRIFMNNVLDYNGYRFFQSSYDSDEKGTILSVNHDFYGTWITYFGYILLAIGFIFALMSKTSNFRALIRKNKLIRQKRATGIIAIFLLLFLGNSAYSQKSIQKPIDSKHAEKFGHLTVQTFDGRFAPMHTLAVDVIHKFSRKDNFDVPGKGKMTNMQVFLDMILDSEYWKQQQIIYIREKSLREIIGVEGTYATFNDFFDKNGKYKLQKVSETSFRKKQSEQNTLDKEIIKVDERVNICMMVFKGEFLKIFPLQNSKSEPWIDVTNPLASTTLTGNVSKINNDLKLENFNYNNIIQLYFSEVYKSLTSKDYSQPNKIIEYLSDIQRQSNYADVIPTKSKIDFEIMYNKLNIFSMLRNIYAFLSLFILIFAFIENLSLKKRNSIKWTLNVLSVLLALAFLYHTFGMAIRWYLSGHAPWSNGYEALILVGWGSVFAGFCFIRNSKITLGASALLAFFMLMTAGHSSYDPQLTNLQPVLKSYWLIIHVATLTISYSFLGSGFFLGIINLVLSLFTTKKNKTRFNLVIQELTGINEMNLTIGIGLAAVGTFLGGVWANESWGRYWGWDAKETWALVIIMAYTIVLHLRFIPKMRTNYIFNTASVLAFGTVLMTFIGVNYYLSKGMHSYGAGETPIFPIWAWILIVLVITLITASGIKENKKTIEETN